MTRVVIFSVVFGTLISVLDAYFSDKGFNAVRMLLITAVATIVWAYITRWMASRGTPRD